VYWYNNGCPPFFRDVSINPAKHLENSEIYVKKLFGACLYNTLLIPSDPGDFLSFNAFITVSKFFLCN